ncbi:hypothetical protein HOY82DRAFT_621732 [Tuber indicum]|nr:hypothetical protein HOY82DRAFT_621732 [Tuber indicum]
MPSWLHECAGAWLHKVINKACSDRLVSSDWIHTIDIMSSPKVQNFEGDYVGRAKEPDLAFIPRTGPGWAHCAAFPSVVLETGYSESASSLSEDAILWREGSSYAVKVVILVKFQRHHDQDPVSVALTIGHAFPSTNGETTLFQDYHIFPIPQLRFEDPSISLDEFYAGHCPPTMDPETEIPLNLATLRSTAAVYIREQGSQPA